MRCNGKELDAEVRGRIERGWEVRMDGVNWWLVCAVRTRPSGGRSLIVYMPEEQRLGEVGVCPGEGDATKPHKHALAYLFRLKDTVTREEAEKMVGKGWWFHIVWAAPEGSTESNRPAWEPYANHLAQEATHIKSPGDPYNCWRIEEEKL